MIYILRYVFGFAAMFIGIYGLFTSDFAYQSYMIFFLALMMLMTGIEELRSGKKKIGALSIAVFLFLLIVSLQDFFL